MTGTTDPHTITAIGHITNLILHHAHTSHDGDYHTQTLQTIRQPQTWPDRHTQWLTHWAICELDLHLPTAAHILQTTPPIIQANHATVEAELRQHPWCLAPRAAAILDALNRGHP